MIGRLAGILIEKKAPDLLVDVSGVGYDVKAPMSTFYRLPDIGNELVLHIHFIAREDGQQLYGFYDKDERQLFRHLIKVNGVGPSMALTILSGIEPDEFKRCIIENDVAALVRLPKVGKKTAERLVVEMADKLQEWAPAKSVMSQVEQTKINEPVTDIVKEAISALVALGFKPQQATKTINGIAADDNTTETLIKEALKALA